MICVMLVAVVGGWALGQPAVSPVSQSELAASAPTPQPQSEAITPAEAPKPNQVKETQQPQPSETPTQTKTPVASPSTAPQKRVAAFWLIVPGK